MRSLTKIKQIAFIILGSIMEIFIIPLLCVIIIIQRCFFSRTSTQSKNIFMGMMHINNWTYVAQALREQGYYVQVVPWIIPDHELDVIPYDVNLKKQYPIFYSSFVGQYFLSYWLFAWAIYKFDIFIIPFRNRLLDRTAWVKWFEIPLLQLAGKKVILNTFGADVATPRLQRKNVKYSLYDGYIADPQYQGYNEHAILRNTRFLEKQADCIISAIDHVDYLQRVDEYFHLRCIDTKKIQPNFGTRNEIPIFIHAPNHRAIKGTDKIIAAIDSLNRRGFSCSLKIVENTSNAKLLEMISESDAVIDQLLLGTYARLAIEAMALGKPVFCYLRTDLYEYNKIWKECPIINVNPETIEQCLEKFLISTRDIKHKIGQESRSYIEKYHSLEYVGRRFDQIISKVYKNDSNR